MWNVWSKTGRYKYLQKILIEESLSEWDIDKNVWNIFISVRR